MSKLLIVESPTKARTISRMLGKDYEIVASMGHIRDLPEHELGVDIANDFTPKYVDTDRGRQIVKSLRAAARKADEIYLAPDPDREGEAIAWHLWNVLKSGVKSPFYRVAFHEITRSAIEQAMATRGEINQNLVDAQQARRVLDRLVGYEVSPLLWSRFRNGRSAGRVQSVALRLIVDREIPSSFENSACDRPSFSRSLTIRAWVMRGILATAVFSTAGVSAGAVDAKSRFCISLIVFSWAEIVFRISDIFARTGVSICLISFRAILRISSLRACLKSGIILFLR